MNGVPEPTASLLDRVRSGSRRPATPPDGPIDAGRQIDTGGMSAAGFGQSPLSQSATMPGQYPSRIYDGYDPVTSGASNGTTFSPARLVQRISPQRGVRKEYEGGGP